MPDVESVMAGHQKKQDGSGRPVLQSKNDMFSGKLFPVLRSIG
jgi:hypothetical protein